MTGLNHHTDMLMQIHEVTAQDDIDYTDNVLCRIPLRISGESEARIRPFKDGSVTAKFTYMELHVDNIKGVCMADKSPHGMTVTFTGEVGLFAQDIVSALDAVLGADFLEVTGTDGVASIYDPEITIALNACV